MRAEFRISISTDARQYLRNASDFYNKQRDDLGGRYLHEVVKTLDVIGERPLSFPVVHHDIRRAMLRRFPHGIFFRINQKTIRVLAVLDLRRHPRTWQRRG